jgi:DNA-binding transcriptional ArsR family regulator
VSVQAGFSRIAALLADPAREAMVIALYDGLARPATELASLAGVSPQSASGHLAKLVDGGVLAVWPQGRFRYFRLASEEVAHAVEALARVAQPDPTAILQRAPGGDPLKEARSCYSHLAGRLGVALALRLAERGYVQIGFERAELTEAGALWGQSQKLSWACRSRHSAQVRPCLDWSERRVHLAGPFPTALLNDLVERKYLSRGSGRTLSVTDEGRKWFALLGIDA